MATRGASADKKSSIRAGARQLLVFDHLDRVAAPILASIAERVKSAEPGLLGVRLAFDKEVAPSLQNNPAWRQARSELLSSLVAHVSHNPLLLGLEIPRMPLPAMYCHSLSTALRSSKSDVTGPRKLQFLRMNGCRLCHGSVSVLVPALIACVELRLLDLSGCGLRADAAKPLAALLQGHSRRRTAEQARAENERWFSSLRTREAELPEAPAAPRGLETLILRDNELRNRGAATLGAALLQDRWLSSLDLRHNGIGAAALSALEEAAAKAGNGSRVVEVLLEQGEPTGAAARAAARAEARAEARWRRRGSPERVEEAEAAQGPRVAGARRRRPASSAAAARSSSARGATPLRRLGAGASSRRRAALLEAEARALVDDLRSLGVVGGPMRAMPPEAWEELSRACGGPRCLLDGVELLLRRGVELVEDKTAALVQERSKLVELHAAAHAQPSGPSKY